MRILIYIVLVIFLFSCMKEATVMVSTVNKVTGGPMPGVTIFATEDLSWDPVNTAKGVFYEGTTDQNGKLVINFKMRNNGKYQLIQQVEGSCWHNEKSFPF